MFNKEIFATINLAHYFESAFTAEQVYRYLRIKLDRQTFDETLETLKRQNLIYEKHKALFTKDLEKAYQQKKIWSRDLFNRHKAYLWLIAKAPWVKYAALTGANAFESCKDKDDIDLFLITKKNRLWICYTLLVVVSKLSRKREILCLNYLVDEENLHFKQQNYYTAVQIMQMVPLFDNVFSRKLIEQNAWVFDFLPNAEPELPKDSFYVIKNGKQFLNGNGRLQLKFMAKLNYVVFQRYSQRLVKKYPDKIGAGIVLNEGVAKLNRVDHQDIYEKIYQNIHREIEESLSI